MTTSLAIALDAALDRFRVLLRDRNQPATPQRLAIASVVLGAERPLAAEEVVERLRAAGPAPGVATVYRTLDVLVECGLVAEEDRREGFRRFRPRRDDVSSAELLCTACGGVTPVTAAAVGVEAAAIARGSGFVAVRHRLTVYGLCARCATDRATDRAAVRPAGTAAASGAPPAPSSRAVH